MVVESIPIELKAVAISHTLELVESITRLGLTNLSTVVQAIAIRLV